MSSNYRLTHHLLTKKCDLSPFNFEDTSQLKELKGIMGQKRAEIAMKFGLSVNHNSYHIYMRGGKGTGKTTYAKEILKKIAAEKQVPDDWCYVYNFLETDKAMAISLPAGQGRVFKKDMDEMIEELVVQVSRAYKSDDYDRQRNEISKKYQDDKNRLITYLTEFASERNHVLKQTSTGFMFKTKLGGVDIDEEDLDIDQETKDSISAQREEVQEVALEILLKIKNLEREAKKRLVMLENRIAIYVINPIIRQLQDKYQQRECVLEYLKKVEEDLIENIHKFIMEDDEDIINLKEKIEGNTFLRRYMVNLFVDNASLKGAPVIMEFNPTLNRLTGTVEYINENGLMKTSFLQIKPGAVHLSNGGYLLLEAGKLLSNPYAWNALKRILQTGEVSIENIGSQLGIDVATVKLEAIPVNFKLILIGNEYLHFLLTKYDEEFQKYFKVLVDFDEDMERSEENEMLMTQFVAGYTKSKNLKPFNKESVGRLIEYSSRIAENQNKLSAKFNKIIDIIVEAHQWAVLSNSIVVDATHIEKAIENIRYRNSKYQYKSIEEFEKQKILIDVKGEKVGVINGLSVISYADETFGRPSVITVTTSCGVKGIVNIEREVKLSGSIYDKGILIMTGFMQEKFGQKGKLSFTAHITFEQTYGGVDGDSASSGELYCLISSLSGVPIKQNIAVTGSINQKGYIQPIGGVNHKIEGFYKICKNRGLTGKQGVIIPYQNVENLMLSQEVIDAVKDGIFHIYAIKHINEGIEILTEEDYESVFGKVEEKLKHYSEISKE